MANFAVIVSCLSVVGILIGIVFPRLSLFWYTGRRNRFKVIQIYTYILIVSFVVHAITN